MSFPFSPAGLTIGIDFIIRFLYAVLMYIAVSHLLTSAWKISADILIRFIDLSRSFCLCNSLLAIGLLMTDFLSIRQVALCVRATNV